MSKTALTWRDLTRGPNRDLDRLHVDMMKWSIGLIGYRREYPILVDRSGVVVDGQHRFAACKELGVQAAFSVTDDLTPEIARIAAIPSRPWSQAHDLGWLALNDHPNAQAFSRLCMKWTARPRIVMRAARMSVTRSKVLNTQAYAHADIDGADAVMCEMQMFRVLGINPFATEKLVSAHVHMRAMPGYDIETMRGALQKHGLAKYNSHGSVLDQLRNLVAIYNYRRPLDAALVVTPEMERRCRKH